MKNEEEKKKEGAAKMEWLSFIDSTTLSHSELQALSLTSLNPTTTTAAATTTSTRHLPTPKIDPTVFNESAGSHRQTYSRPRRPRRVAALLPPPTLPADHRLIIDYLKQLIREDPRFDQVELLQPPVPPPPEIFDAGGGERKRKRGRKPKLKVQLEECYRGMDIVNKDGVAIDLAALASMEEPFAVELARRTEGLSGDEELLGFLSDLSGQWGSRRKKRRIVDAADFGDVLPLGWKLILGLKRKEGRAWIYCRRYISPSGQQFESCKEVSSYLLSLLGHRDVQFEISSRSENIRQEQQRVTAENSVGVTSEEQEQQQIVVTNSDVSGSLSIPKERLKEVALLEMENLADVQIQDLFECHKCNMSFDEKDSYLQHLLSVHQKTTRRYRLGSSVGDGVIIKDGKFECQFCHKVFSERRRYNGHVGIHVRNYVRKAEDLPGQPNVQRADKSPAREEMPSRISKMDALIEIAQNSIMEDTVMEPHSLSELHMIPISEIAVGDMDQDINSDSPVSEQQLEDSLIGKNVVQDLNQQDSPCLLVDEEVEKIDDDNRVIDAEMFTCSDNMDMLSVNNQTVNALDASKGKDEVAPIVEAFDQSGINLGGVSQSPLPFSTGNHIIPESVKSENSGYTSSKAIFKLDEDNSNKSQLKNGLDHCKDVPVIANVQVAVMPAFEKHVVQSVVSNSSVSPEQSLDCFSAFSSDKGGKQFCNVDHEHDNVNGFQELRLNEIGPLEYDFASVQGPIDVLTESANNTVVEGTYASPVQSKSQEVMLNVDDRNQLTTVCVWCGIEFNHDAVNSETTPDSVGFMCPACKARISSQINVLDSGSPNAVHL